MPASCCLLCGSQPGVLSCVQSLCLGFPKGHQRLPKWSSGKEPACQRRRHKRCRFNLWVGKIPWRRKWQPTPVFLTGKFHGQKSLVGYGPWGSKELDTTERACTHTRDIKSMSPGGHRACLQNEASAKRKGKDCLIPETIHGWEMEDWKQVMLCGILKPFFVSASCSDLHILWLQSLSKPCPICVGPVILGRPFPWDSLLYPLIPPRKHGLGLLCLNCPSYPWDDTCQTPLSYTLQLFFLVFSCISGGENPTC